MLLLMVRKVTARLEKVKIVLQLIPATPVAYFFSAKRFLWQLSLLQSAV
jgi:hypothetical protein